MYTASQINSDSYQQKSAVPPFYLKNPVVQTVLSSLKIKNRFKEKFDHVSQEIIIDAGKGIRLAGHYSENTEKRKLLILFHGWEGSEKSAYMVSAGRYFYRSGYSILRLNMRDHGSTHHLNKGLFYGTLIDEAFAAVKEAVKRLAPEKDIYIAGFSMGGNFALRIARLAGKDSYLKVRIKKIIAVNPPLNPYTSTANIDRYFFIKKYFLKKWKKSLYAKERTYPDLYDFSFIREFKGCFALTDILVDKYSEYIDLEDYFSRYTLKKDFFKEIAIPVFIITAEDDPIIEVSDFSEIEKACNPHIELQIEKYGGHCAYLENIKLKTRLFDILEKKIIHQT